MKILLFYFTCEISYKIKATLNQSKNDTAKKHVAKVKNFFTVPCSKGAGAEWPFRQVAPGLLHVKTLKDSSFLSILKTGAAVSIFSIALVWLDRIGSWGDGTSFRAKEI